MCAAEADESGQFCPECGAAFDASFASAATGLLEASPDSPDEPASSKLIGVTIDHQFVVESVLGGGAFATVYRGQQLGLDRPVAIKVPTHAIAVDPIMAKRFAREARSAARIHHPGVVTIYAVGELDDGRPYLVMELVTGQPLDKILADGPLAPARALRIIRAIASALSETHAAEVVHRDLKPTNIVWRRDRNGDDQITIVDFGIAASKPGNAESSRLTANGLIGTPHYMSPEQAHGERVDARSDLYALGCLLFELVTGAPPFEGSGFEVLLAHLGRPAPAPSERNPEVPEAIDRLCEHWLAKAPADRPANADEVVAAVDDVLAQLAGLGGERAAGSSARSERARAKRKTGAPTRNELPVGATSPAKRRARRVVAGAVLAGVALGGAGFAAWNLGHGDGGAATARDDDDEPTTGGVFSPKRELDADDGEIVLHVRVPDPIFAGLSARARIEIKNKLGQPISTPELVLTIADARGGVKGATAHPRRNAPGQYVFRTTFAHPGHYTLRVFPPSVDSSFEIPLDVR
jgi:tRNA A-37 threonylcarbamoyl transferase component Bud32